MLLLAVYFRFDYVCHVLALDYIIVILFFSPIILPFLCTHTR